MLITLSADTSKPQLKTIIDLQGLTQMITVYLLKYIFQLPYEHCQAF